MPVRRAVIATVGVQYFAAVMIETISGFRYSPPLAVLLTAALALSIFALGGMAALSVIRSMIQKSDPLRAVKSALDVDIPFTYFMVAAQLSVLSWLKAAMPYSVGFRFDELLANLDAAIFGVDPWRLLQGLPAGIVDRAYISWAWTTILLMLILPLLPRTVVRDRAIVTYFLVVASCSLGQYLLPSAGPIFYERIGLGERFAELPVQPWVQVTSDYLWTNYLSRGELVGVGISAFPSLHVAGTAWVAIVVSTYLQPLKWLAWAYFILLMIGSVLLGWHYAIDGIAGTLLALAAWKLTAWSAKQAVSVAG